MNRSYAGDCISSSTIARSWLFSAASPEPMGRDLGAGAASAAGTTSDAMEVGTAFGLMSDVFSLIDTTGCTFTDADLLMRTVALLSCACSVCLCFFDSLSRAVETEKSSSFRSSESSLSLITAVRRIVRFGRSSSSVFTETFFGGFSESALDTVTLMLFFLLMLCFATSDELAPVYQC